MSDQHETRSAGHEASEGDVQAVYDAAYRVARREGLTDVEAEDVAQASTSVVWGSWASIDSPRAYVATVAQRTAWGVRGARRDQRPLDPDERAEAPGDLASEVVAQVFLTDLLASLPPQQALTIDLHYLKELTLGEVASVLGVTVNTVKTHNRRALEALRNLKDDYES